MLDVKYFQKIIKIFMLSPSLFLRRALCIDDVGNNVTSVFCWEDHCEHNNEAGMEKLIDTKTIWGLSLSLSAPPPIHFAPNYHCWENMKK